MCKATLTVFLCDHTIEGKAQSCGVVTWDRKVIASTCQFCGPDRRRFWAHMDFREGHYPAMNMVREAKRLADPELHARAMAKVSKLHATLNEELKRIAQFEREIERKKRDLKAADLVIMEEDE